MAALPSITVVTPCLNAAATLGETLESVSAQEYPGRVEHLVVDGGSSDGSLDILRAAEGVHVTSEPDRGLSDAMNKGIARATGEVIGWLNADARYLPGALRAVVEAFAACPEASWVTGRCSIIDAAGREIRGPVSAYKNLLLRAYSLPLLLSQNFVCAPATFVRRDAYRAVGGFDLAYRISGDYDVWLRLARRQAPRIVHGELACFRMAEGSLSMAGFERQFAEHADCARRNGAGHPLAVAANQVVSRLIIATYRALRARRAWLAARASA